jgi:hypothetical protein
VSYSASLLPCLTVPLLSPAPIGPHIEDELVSPGPFDPGGDARYRDLRQRIVEVCTLTEYWNRTVGRQRWRLAGWDGDSHPDFHVFLAQTGDPWLRDFLNWAETCALLGMGLFLDF